MPGPPAPPSPGWARSSAPRAGAAAGRKQAGATPSQLDILAEINERVAAQGSGRGTALQLAFACAGVALLVAALVAGFLQRREVPAAPLPPQPVRQLEASAPSPTVLPPDAAPPVAGMPLAEPAPPAAADAPSAVPMRRDAAGKGAATPARTERRQREAERPARVSADAAESSPLRPATGSGLASEPPPTAVVDSSPSPGLSVRDQCAGRGNIVSELLCRTRECRRPERRDDRTCMALREIEESRSGGIQQ